MGILDLVNFGIRDLTESGRVLRQMGQGAESMEDVADRVVGYMYDNFLCGMTGERECALVRMFKTHDYGGLDEGLKSVASGLLGGSPVRPGLKCLVLLATAGERPEWRSRATSAGHKAIPLPDEESVYNIPMVWNMVKELGLDVGAVIRPDARRLPQMAQQRYNVFFVPEALGSPHVPAQENFVIPYGIKSAVGFGGVLPSGNIFSAVMFLKVRIPREAADLFSPLSLNVKLALLPFLDNVFSKKTGRAA